MLYPVAVLIIVVFGSAFIFGPGQDYFVNVQARQQKAAELEAKKNALSRKLDLLNRADDVKMENDLKTLLTAMPAKKDVWGLLVELNQAASGSGASLFSYKGAGGNVSEASESAVTTAAEDDPIKLDVTYKISKFEDVAYILKNLQEYLPLNKILSVSFEDDEAVISIEAAWSPWEKVSGDVEEELPNGYESTAATALKQLEGLREANINRDTNTEVKYVSSPF